MIDKALFSSAYDEWETPRDFFDTLDKEFHFTLDAASSDENALCEKHFTKEQDALKQSWQTSGSVWCNPPYGREIGKWMRKAFEESRGGQTVVMLVPARTDTKWFHEWVYGKAELRFVRGRLCFSKHGERGNRAPFPSMVVIYGG